MQFWHFYAPPLIYFFRPKIHDVFYFTSYFVMRDVFLLVFSLVSLLKHKKVCLSMSFLIKSCFNVEWSWGETLFLLILWSAARFLTINIVICNVNVNFLPFLICNVSKWERISYFEERCVFASCVCSLSSINEPI